MTTKQIDKLKTPRFIQQLESTLKPLEFLNSCAKTYGKLFTTNSFGSLETLFVSHSQDLQKLFNPKNNTIATPGATNEIFKYRSKENSLILQDGACHLI